VPAQSGGTTTLFAVRARIQERLYAGFGREIFWVFNSQAEPALTDQTTIGRCLDEARRAHVFICLCTGDPGAQDAENPLGICHQELQAAINDSPDKVVLIRLRDADAQLAKHREFRILVEDFQRTHRKWISFARTDDELVDGAVAAAYGAVRRMGARALAQWRRSRSYSGSRFRWASKTYSERTTEIASILVEQFTRASGVVRRPFALWQPALLQLPLGTTTLLVSVSAVPDGFGVADARKYAGYPFRDDDQHRAAAHGAWTGPLHVVGVYKSITESQMRSHLGNADIAIFKTEFGYLAQDRSQAIQVAYLWDCSEEDAAVEAAALFLRWLTDADASTQISELGDRRRAMLTRA
jgi:hypothetical protein